MRGKELRRGGRATTAADLRRDETESGRTAGIAEDQAVPALPQNQMIVLERDHRRRLDAQFPGHAQMDAQPAAFGKAEEHLFAVRLGTQQRRAAQGFWRRRRPSAKYFLAAFNCTARIFRCKPRPIACGKIRLRPVRT